MVEERLYMSISGVVRAAEGLTVTYKCPLLRCLVFVVYLKYKQAAIVGSPSRNCELGQSCNRFTNGTAVLIKQFRLTAALCDLVVLCQTLKAILSTPP